MIDLKQFEKCFVYWIKNIARETKGKVIAIDGKTGLVLGQVKTDEKAMKSLQFLNSSICFLSRELRLLLMPLVRKRTSLRKYIRIKMQIMF